MEGGKKGLEGRISRNEHEPQIQFPVFRRPSVWDEY